MASQDTTPEARSVDPDDRVTVGVLSFHNSKESKAILNAVEALGHGTEWLREENVVFRIEGDVASLEPDVDVVANRLLLSNTDQPTEELGIARTLAALRPMLNPPDATARAAHKTAAAAVLSATSGTGVEATEGAIRLPRTLLALSGDRLNRLREEFGPEAVYKTAIGTHGGGAWKVDTSETLTAKVGRRRAFLQELVGREDDERPRDLRVYVVGGEVVGAMYRVAAEGDWRTNVARGGTVEDATEDLPADAERQALRSAEVIGLDYAGVDLIEGEDGWYVLEVNPTAGFKGLYRATGRSPAPHIARLAVERAGGTVDDDRVRELTATLDDSTPSCKPTPESEAFDEPVVLGFTERVVVSGTSGTRTVVGKSDTGAARTSIDLQLAAEIGAGPIHTVSRVRSGSSTESRPRPVVDLVVGIAGTQHTVEANVEDRSHMSHPLLLGRDVLRHYHLDISRRVDDTSVREEEPTEE
jgi:RimK family alpha-L-glutamate ligase